MTVWVSMRPFACRPLLPLEGDQRLRCPGPQHAIRLASVEALLLQHDLHLADLIRTEIDDIAGAACLRAAASAVELRSAAARGRHRQGRHDLATAVDDHDVVVHHKIFMSSPLRINLDQRRRDLDHADPGRHRHPHVERKVDSVDAGDVVAGKHGLLDPGALLRGQSHVAVRPALPSLVGLPLVLLSLALRGLRLILLGLALLGLALFRRALLSLSFTLVGLTLLTLRSLSLRLIALAALALAALLALPLAGGRIALSFTALFGLAVLVLPLRAVAAFLLVPALRALVTFLWLRLAGGLIPLLPVFTALRLVALVLCSRPPVLCASLHIAPALLLAVRAGGIALALRAVRNVLGGREGLQPASQPWLPITSSSFVCLLSSFVCLLSSWTIGGIGAPWRS